MYKLGFKRSALVEWRALDNSVREPLRKALKKRLKEPHIPKSALHGPLHNCYKIKLKTSGFRLVYKVEGDVLTVVVLVIGKREKSQAYRLAVERLLEGLATGSDPVDV